MVSAFITDSVCSAYGLAAHEITDAHIDDARRALGRLLEKMLEGNPITKTELAKQLQLPPNFLNKAFTGTSAVTKRLLIDEKVLIVGTEPGDEADFRTRREILCAISGAQWDGAAYDACAATLGNYSKHLTLIRARLKLPEESASIQGVLLDIIGREETDIVAAAKHLKLRPIVLAGIIIGEIPLYREMAQFWQPLLKEKYPEAWLQHGPKFLDNTEELDARRSRGHWTSSEKNRAAFGALVKEIIGGEGHIGEAVQLLDVNYEFFRNVLLGRREVSKGFVNGERLDSDHKAPVWAEVFAEHYPEMWAEYEKTYFLLEEMLPERGPERKKRQAVRKRGPAVIKPLY